MAKSKQIKNKIKSNNIPIKDLTTISPFNRFFISIKKKLNTDNIIPNKYNVLYFKNFLTIISQL